MSTFVIEGGRTLRGSITPQGAKNEALEVISAVLLSSEPVTITTGATPDDSQYFFSDNPNYSVGTNANGQLCLTYSLMLPAYMQEPDVPENFKTNWANWAIRYGVGTNAEYETAFLLNISPYTEIAPTSAPLKVVDFRSTSTGYRFELASDVCGLFQHDGDEGDTLLCNGALALEVATDLSALAQSHVSIPVPVVIDTATGHAVIEMNISDYLNAYPLPLPSNIELPSPLFFRPALTPIYPDLMQFFLLFESP